jgi:hypothetical protein
MIIPYLHRLGGWRNPTVIVGIVISLIMLALGGFLYMRTEGEEVSPLESQLSASLEQTNPAVMETSVQGEPMVISNGQENKPFIMAMIPGDAVLENGSYQITAGAKLHVRIRAINVENGMLYYKPMDSKQKGLIESEKVGELLPSDLPGEYEVEFGVQKDTSGLLIALMKGKDGQEVQLSVNVTAQR